MPTTTPTVTPLNMVQVTGRMASVYLATYGRMPPASLNAFAAAVVGVENAGGARILENNVGNVTAPAGYDGMTWQANGLTFISFTTIYDGIEYWWELMRRRYPAALIDAACGSFDTAVRDMLRLGYIGLPTTEQQENDYIKGVRGYLRQTLGYADTIARSVQRPYVGGAIAVGSLGVLGLLGWAAHGGMR